MHVANVQRLNASITLMIYCIHNNIRMEYILADLNLQVYILPSMSLCSHESLSYYVDDFLGFSISL